MSGVTRQSMRLGVSMALLAGLMAGGASPQGFAPGLNASTFNANQASRGEGSWGGTALARILGSGQVGRKRGGYASYNGRAHTGVAAQRRIARKRRQYLAQKRIGKRVRA